jgi:hypothetical protein
VSKKNWFFTVLVAAFVLAEFVAVMIYAIRAIQYTEIAQLGQLKVLSITVNALAAVGDVLIAGILCWMLHNSRTGFKS